MLVNITNSINQELLNKVTDIIKSDDKYKFINHTGISLGNIRNGEIYASMKGEDIIGLFFFRLHDNTISNIEDINLSTPSNITFARDLISFADTIDKLKPMYIEFDIAMGNFRSRNIDRRLCTKYNYIPDGKPQFIGIQNKNAIFRHRYKKSC